jgi:hypothetical protein
MADRYWVGGTQTWDNVAGTKWATTSGGAGGASVPFSADNVIFDTNSGTGTVTVNTVNASCANFTVTATQAITIQSSGSFSVSVYGSVFSLVSGGSASVANLNLNFVSATTLTTNGKSIGSMQIGATPAQVVQLADNLTITNGFTLGQGTFTTNNFNTTTGSSFACTSNTGTTATLNLGSSTVTVGTNFTCSGAGTNTLNLGSSTIVVKNTFSLAASGITLNAGTSTISFTTPNGTPVLSATGYTFNNVTFNSNTNYALTCSSCSFNNLTIGNSTSSTIRSMTVSGNNIVTGTFQTASTTPTQRVFIQSDTLGTARTFTCAAVSLSDADFADITAAGVAAPFTGTRLGNCKGNTNITFPAAKTVYWNLAGAQNWSATAWATSSGGTPAVNNFPLAQDTAVFDNAGSVTGNITIDRSWNIGELNCGTRSTTMRILVSSTPNCYGNVTLDIAGVRGLNAINGAFNFCGRNTQTVTTNANKWGSGLQINSVGGTVILADDFYDDNSGSGTILTAGTLNANNKNINTYTFTLGASSNSKSLLMGSGTFTIAGYGTVFDVETNASGFTLTANTSTIKLSNEEAFSKTFRGNGNTFYNLLFAGSGYNPSGYTFNIFGSNTFNSVTNTVIANISIIIDGDTTVGSWNVSGYSSLARVTLSSRVSGAFGQRTITKTGGGTINVNYCSISYSRVLPAGIAFATNSIDGGNNTNWSFIATPSSGSGLALFK